MYFADFTKSKTGNTHKKIDTALQFHIPEVLLEDVADEDDSALYPFPFGLGIVSASKIVVSGLPSPKLYIQAYLDQLIKI